MSYRFNARVGRAKPIGGTASNTRQASQEMRAIIKEYERLINHIQNVSPNILMDALRPTFNKSQIYVPKKTGKLAKSGYLRITHRGKTPRVEIGYGYRGNPEYAADVHEELEWRHKYPTRAKYLQAALAEDANEIQANIYRGYLGILK